MWVPGDFVPDSRILQDNSSFYPPVPTSHHCLPQSYTPSHLQSVEYVLIRHDAHLRPLQPPYDGPFRVIEAGEKHFVVDIGSKEEHISVESLKPAHLDKDRPVALAQPPQRGRPAAQPKSPSQPPLSNHNAAETPRAGTSHPS